LGLDLEDPRETNVCKIRLLYRQETLQCELNALEMYATESFRLGVTPKAVDQHTRPFSHPPLPPPLKQAPMTNIAALAVNAITGGVSGAGCGVDTPSTGDGEDAQQTKQAMFSLMAPSSVSTSLPVPLPASSMLLMPNLAGLQVNTSNAVGGMSASSTNGSISGSDSAR
jgi:hypothetical protein